MRNCTSRNDVSFVSRTRCSALSLRRRAGTHFHCSMDPGSAAHRAANHSASKTRVNALMALRSIRGTLAATPPRFRRHPEEPRILRGVSKDARTHRDLSSFEARRRGSHLQ